MMQESTWKRARDYAQDMRDQGRPAIVVALSFLANGYDQGDPRSMEWHGHAVDTWNASNDTRTIVMWRDIQCPANMERSMFIIDSGRTTEGFYVAGWGSDNGALFLNPFPTNYMSNGERVVRADNGAQVDYGNWRLPAVKAYHVKWSDRIPVLRDFNAANITRDSDSGSKSDAWPQASKQL